MVIKITKADADGAVEYVCDTTDDISVWPADCGAGSTMTIIDKTATPPVVSGDGFFDGSVWAMIG